MLRHQRREIGLLRGERGFKAGNPPESLFFRGLHKLQLYRLFPVPTYHERGAGPYITAGVLVAKDPETGIRNASIHRIRVFEDGMMSLLILPRHLDLCLQKCVKMNRPLKVAVAIGVDPFTLLACCCRFSSSVRVKR